MINLRRRQQRLLPDLRMKEVKSLDCLSEVEAKKQIEEDIKHFFQIRDLDEAEVYCQSTFEEGFTPTAEILDAVAIDVPNAYPLFVTMAKGAGLNKDEERYIRFASKSWDNNKLLHMLTS
ncbi:hypothetical protein EW026_g6894 [Hermanssonia centrifuga]|uniref:Uncharacterized protein n=1 Tax=Hermanssonia centrifuga TaxID=98765 RepID=A0A4V3X9L4_9APHY|nr:hypothetical protein EW026_g6894 [Hermanssonia centrifuga]